MDPFPSRWYPVRMSPSRPLLIGALALCGCVAGPAFREHLLATIPEDARVVVPVVFSGDGRRATWVEQRGGLSRAVCGERRGKPYGVVC